MKKILINFCQSNIYVLILTTLEVDDNNKWLFLLNDLEENETN